VTYTMDELERDQSAHAQTELPLALLDTIFAAVPVGLAYVDRSFRFVRVNEALAAMNGATPQAQIGRTVGEVLPELAAQLDPLWRRILATGEPIVDMELSGETHGMPGQQRRLLASYYPVRGQDGRTSGIGIVVVDITERRWAEDTQRFLAEASAVLASSLDYGATLASVARLAVPTIADWCAVDILAEDGLPQRLAVAHVDPAKLAWAVELHQRYPPDSDEATGLFKVLRSGVADFYPEITDDLLVASARDQESLQIMRAIGFTSYMCVPLGARERTLGAITLVWAESRRRYQASDLALAEELARRAAIAVDNAQLYRDAQRAVRARDQFLASASHELKTPLTTLLGNAQLLERRAARAGSYSERDLRAIRVIANQSTRLNKMIEALLDLARIQLGQLSISRIPLDLQALTLRVVEEIQPALERHTLRLLVPDTPVMIAADELRIEQVLQNLIQNAMKYSPAGGLITIELEQQARLSRLAVGDQGIGIPAAAIPHLFTRFYRAANADEQHISGMGVGLYVVRKIVALHGGQVTVTSTQGVGSTFIVNLPLLDTI